MAYIFLLLLYGIVSLNYAKSEDTVLVIEGEEAIMECATTSPIQYEWFNESSNADNRVAYFTIIPGTTITFYNHLTDRATGNVQTGQLNITSTRLWPETDEYLYICKGTSSTPGYVRLIINVPPGDFTMDGIPDEVIAEEPLDGAICEVDRLKPVNGGMITWKLNGEDIAFTSRIEDNTGAFKLVSTADNIMFERTDIQVIECTFTWESGEPVIKSKQVKVLWRPTIINITANVDPFPESSVTLSCEYTAGNPATPNTVRWDKDDVNITDDQGGKYEDWDSERLTIKNLHEDDNGTYRCHVRNRAGEMTTDTGFSLQVFKPHTVVITRIDPSYIIEGNNVTIYCDADGGYPDHTLLVEWEKDGSILPSDNVQDTNYFISDVRREDAGGYICKVKNFDFHTGWGNSSSFLIDVKYPPFWKGPNEFGGIPGTPLTVTCNVCANPEPSDWQWTYGGSSQDGITDLNNGSIVIDRFNEKYEGNYSCRVNNGIGNILPVFWITVKGAGRPSTPVGFQALGNITSITITVQWTPGYNGGYPQTFTLEYKEVNGDNVTFKDGIEDTGEIIVINVIDLEPETTYDFKVTAKNQEGESDPAEITGHQTKSKPDIKFDEIIVEANQMVVKWKYTEPDMRIKRNTNSMDTENIGVAVEYRKSSDDKYIRYPEQGTVDARDEEVTIDGSFDERVGYNVRLFVCEGAWACSKGDEMEQEAPGDDFPVAIVAGVIGGVAGFALIVLVLVLVIRPRVRSSHDTYNPDKPVELNSKDDEVAGEPGVDNPTIQENGVTDEDIIMYETSPITRTPNQANSTPTPVSNGVEPLYSEVDKNKNKNKSKTSDDPNALYAQPDKTKKKTQEDESTPLYAEVDHKKKKKKKKAAPTPEPTYAEVKKPPKDKGKGKKKTSPAKPENAYENVDKSGAAKMSDSVPAEAAYETVDDLKKKSSKPPPPLYDNTPTIDVNKDDGAYSEVELRPPEDKTAGKIIGPDGTLYTEVSFARDEADRKKPGKPPKPTKPVIRRTEEPTEYASIDFTKKAPALEETEEDVAEEVKPEEKKKEEMAFGESKINEDGELEALV